MLESFTWVSETMFQGGNKEIGRKCESLRSQNCQGSQSPLVKLHERKWSLRTIG